MESHILAIGGGSFFSDPNKPLERHLLSLSKKAKPKVCFIGTAGGDDKNAVRKFHQSFSEMQCETGHLSLFKAPEGDLRDFVLDQDIIYVGGGNTRNLIVLWKEWNLHKILKEALQAGVILSGVSAGAICWFEQGLTDSVTGKLLPLDGLGFLKGSFCPHYDGEPQRRPAYQKEIADQNLKPGFACDDGAAAHFVNGKLQQFVSSRPSAKAYKLQAVKGGFMEEEIQPVFLPQNMQMR